MRLSLTLKCLTRTKKLKANLRETIKIMILLLIMVFQLASLSCQFQQPPEVQYFLRKANIQTVPYTRQNANFSNLTNTNLDDFRGLYNYIRHIVTSNMKQKFAGNYKYLKAHGKMQRQVRANEAFPCGLNNTRSTETPSSVHRLRPGDIDIIGAMGDSLTAGTGMMSKHVIEIVSEARGQTLLGGGLKDWRTFLTLPNILKVFNPNLYGYAVANTLARNRPARFNVAEALATTQDMPYMAEVLVKRLQQDVKVDMQQHWKLISIFIGSNDICTDLCNYDNTEDFLLKHRQDLYRTLSILKRNIPRLMVLVITIPDLDKLVTTKGLPVICKLFHRIECSCFVSDTVTAKQLKERTQIMKRQQQIDMEVASLPEFQLDDFAAVPIDVAVNKIFKTLPNGNTDLRYFASDCFHFSQYGNAAYANMLWNDILQNKVPTYYNVIEPFQLFACPTEERPYLATLGNR